MEGKRNSLEKIFRSCSFVAPKQANEASRNNDSDPAGHSNGITSFFVDSSGRSSFTTPLQIIFNDKKSLEEFLAAKSLNPPPHNLISGQNQTESVEDSKTNASVSFEVKSIPSNSDENNQVTVEGVSILSCSVNELVVAFQTKVTVRATSSGPSSINVTTSADSLTQLSPSRFSSSPIKSNTMKKSMNDGDEADIEEQHQQVNLSATFKITPVLTIESRLHEKKKNQVGKNDFSPDLTLLGLAAIPDQMQYSNNTKSASSILSTSNDRVHETRLSPASINVKLTNAFSIAVQSVPGPKSGMGNTLVSLSIRHSKTHNLPVTITNVAVHPGHSRHDVVVARSKVEGPPIIQQAVCKYHGFNGKEYNVVSTVRGFILDYLICCTMCN